MASAAVSSKVVVLLFFFMDCYRPQLCMGIYVLVLACFAVLCIFSSFAIISLQKKRELIALLLICSECHFAVIGL